MAGIADQMNMNGAQKAGIALSMLADAVAMGTGRQPGYTQNQLNGIQALQRQMLLTQQIQDQNAKKSALSKLTGGFDPLDQTGGQVNWNATPQTSTGTAQVLTGDGSNFTPAQPAFPDGAPSQPGAGGDPTAAPTMAQAGFPGARNVPSVDGGTFAQVALSPSMTAAQNADMSADQRALLMKAFPDQAGAAMLSKAFAGPKFEALGRGGGVMIDASGNVVKKIPGEGAPPEKPENFLVDGKPVLLSPTSAMALAASGKNVVRAGDVSTKPEETWRDMTPAEVSARGLAAGTVAQINNKGQFEIKSKPTGQDYFSTMPPALTGDDAMQWVNENVPGGKEITGLANQVLSGTRQAGTLSRQGSMNEKVLGLLGIAYPGVDFGQRYKTNQEYSPSGPTGKAINAVNTTLMHADKMLTAFDGMGNSTIPLWNTVGNTATSAVGGAAPAKFNTERDAVASEARKVFSGQAGGGITELNEWKANLPTNASPAQMKASATALMELMHGRLDPLVYQYNQQMGSNKTIEDFLSPQTKKVWAKIEGFAGGDGAPAAAAPPRPQSTAVAPAPAAGAAPKVVIQNGFRCDAQTGAPLGPA